MKTQIIQLEAHDDVISTRDKMGVGQASRILLVWPAKSNLLTRQLDLVLLQRHSNRVGAQLGLVTNDDEVRFYAKMLSIPVFNSLKQAQGDRWRVARRRRWYPKKLHDREASNLERQVPAKQPPAIIERPFVRLIIFSLSILSLLILAGILLPSARINIKPLQEQQSVTLIVSVNPAIDEPELAGTLPVQLATVIVEGRDALPASGVIQVPEKPATGEATFTNLSQESVKIPMGTVVTTLEAPVIRFYTTRASSVRAGFSQKVIVPIQAIVPGTSGNLAANRLQAIEGSLGLSLTVNNIKPTRQGTNRPAVGPTLEDRNKLFNRLLSNLEQTAQKELKSRLSANGEVSDFPLLPSLRLSQVLEETYAPEEDQPADQVNLILRLEFEYQLVSAIDLQKLAAPILAAGVPKGFRSVAGTLRVEHRQAQLNQAGIASWQVVFHQNLESVVIPPQAAEIAHGLPVEQAKERLKESLYLDEVPRITITPSWWPYLPYFTFRILVTLESVDN